MSFPWKKAKTERNKTAKFFSGISFVFTNNTVFRKYL